MIFFFTPPSLAKETSIYPSSSAIVDERYKLADTNALSRQDLCLFFFLLVRLGKILMVLDDTRFSFCPTKTDGYHSYCFLVGYAGVDRRPDSFDCFSFRRYPIIVTGRQSLIIFLIPCSLFLSFSSCAIFVQDCRCDGRAAYHIIIIIIFRGS